MSFALSFLKEISIDLVHDFNDNIDPTKKQRRAGQPFRTKLFDTLRLTPAFETVYGMLADRQSRELLVKVLAYRLLGHKKVKLPLNTARIWEDLKKIEAIADTADRIGNLTGDWELCRHYLDRIGIPLNLYCTSMGICVDFILKQYEYHAPDFEIKAREGHVVIDAGGCWGDTALYFANEVGRSGKVFSFEFIPTNLEVMKRNISLNPPVENTIHIIESPLWSEPDKKVFYIDKGPGSRVTFEQKADYRGETSTVSIDNLLEKGVINKVNFIKMDIEGAEIEALKGAEKTIRAFAPTLAIAVYHRLSDFVNVPVLIKSIYPGYRFYLGHYTIHKDETILFASAQKSSDLSPCCCPEVSL